MAKKAKQTKLNDKLSLENINVGDKILDLHNEEIEITEDLIEQMRKYEQESKKSSIWRGKVTGSFLYFKWIEEHPEEKVEKVIEESLDESIEEQVVDEENELLDCIEDYKMEYNVKSVNVKSQKFKQFFYKWKQEN